MLPGSTVITRAARLVVSVSILAAASGCGSTGGGSLREAVATVTTCADLRKAYEVSATSEQDALLIADRLVEIVESDYAEDGKLDERSQCSLVIADLDGPYPRAFDGIDLDEIDLHGGNARNG